MQHNDKMYCKQTAHWQQFGVPYSSMTKWILNRLHIKLTMHGFVSKLLVQTVSSEMDTTWLLWLIWDCAQFKSSSASMLGYFRDGIPYNFSWHDRHLIWFHNYLHVHVFKHSKLDVYKHPDKSQLDAYLNLHPQIRLCSSITDWFSLRFPTTSE